MQNAGFQSRRTIDREINIFHKNNPSIKVTYEILSWSSAWFKLIKAIKEKTAPDVIQIGTTWIGTLRYLKAIRKLDHQKIKSKNFIPAFLNMCSFKDDLCALPWFCEGRVLFYRKDYLHKADIDVKSIETWKGFRQACLKLSKMRIDGLKVSPLGFSCQKEHVILHDIAALLWTHGADFLSDDGKHASLIQAESRQAIKYFLDLISSRFISRTSLDKSINEVGEDFFMHDAYAFMFTSSWTLQAYLDPSSKHFIGKKNADKFGVTYVPSGPAGRYNFAGGSALAISSCSPNPDKALKLLKFLVGRKSMSRYCKSINMIPGRIDIPAILNTDKQFMNVFQDSINSFGRSFPSHPLWGSIEQIILNGFEEIIRDYRYNKYNKSVFFKNLNEINKEIENILSLFGD